ncbi:MULTISPECIES: DUF1684 domain-containing protein [Streptomyces]|uniref:DUF1684 domain-containing protein n=2 Tax=Streptomyces TaxID=1883 RepID=A0ABU2QVQ6_9ACTN|nr:MULTISPECIES: DUF1684 domain-containing protein [unclassified Streptomyces]MDT0408538.1 DUF1684 domain-containing protein [Streptomyces sp. DSM 41979]MYQ58724.1 DUF1684 domain-containing protein [Streptomyces sp. SID4926]SCD66089.1 hypothetical protein GA0115252_11338 [Streptomyces sp. DfronAA-171]
MSAGDEDDPFLAGWRRWRAARLAQLREPYGVLSPLGLHWLGQYPERHPDVPGLWWADEDGARVRATAEEDLWVDGKRVVGELVVRDRGVIPGPGNAVQVTSGDTRVDVLAFADDPEPGVRWALRPRSPRAPALLAFRDVPALPPSREWVTTAEWEGYDQPRRQQLDTALDTVRREFVLSGRLVFRLAGRELALEPYGNHGDVLNIPFRDQTSGVTTFGAARVVYARRPKGPLRDGQRVVLDFNRAINPPCAFSPYASCALPPRGNTLPIAVEAGELAPRS